MGSGDGGKRKGRSRQRYLPRLTYANVVSALVLFFALGGVAYATDSLPGLSVGSKQLKPNSVKTGKIADRAVTGIQIRNGSIHSRQMGPRLMKRLLGAIGPTGPAGARGLPGLDGTNGIDGAAGPVRATGATGADGTTAEVGATGATEITGPVGATGATGASGTADIQVVTQTVTVTNLGPGKSNSLRAECPPGYLVIAGGFAGGPSSTQAFQSRPDNTLINGPCDSWRAAYVNPSNGPVTGNFTTYAICVPD